MTERKPLGLSWESWIDRQIREGMERGEFDGLAGIGRPLADLDQRSDENHWIREKLRRERVSVPPPPAIQIRIEVDAALGSLVDLEDEAAVRSLVEHLNERIRAVNRTVAFGPPTTIGPLDPDEVVERWRARRSG